MRGRSQIGAQMQVHFFGPLPFDQRSQLPALPGVYVISREKIENVIYIGETTGPNVGLRKRVQTFSEAASGDPNKKRSGGRTYHRELGPDVSKLLLRYHTPQVISEVPDIQAAYIKFVERLLIWRFVEEHGRLPLCNSK